jgi:hypothetical protein
MKRSTCNKRITREIEYIENSLPQYTVAHYIENTDKTMLVSLISPNNNLLQFKFSRDYPFKPPVSLKVNGYNYRQRLNRMPLKIYYLYYHPEKMYMDDTTSIPIGCVPNCLCCSSLLCGGNWTAVLRISDILKELENHNLIKRNIMYKIYLKELADYKGLPLELIKTIYEFL